MDIRSGRQTEWKKLLISLFLALQFLLNNRGKLIIEFISCFDNPETPYFLCLQYWSLVPFST